MLFVRKQLNASSRGALERAKRRGRRNRISNQSKRSNFRQAAFAPPLLPQNKMTTTLSGAGQANDVLSSSSSSSSSSSLQGERARHASPHRRGAFILLEGVDNSGKTTQCGLLLKHLVSLGIAAVGMRFPDRTTAIGALINSYLKGATTVDDRSVHLLFSSNRWESSSVLAQHLADGKTVVCDRYAYSGVAFSSAKDLPDSPLTIEWCRSCDVGLPAPDAIVFLDLPQEAAARREGFGQERYEKRDMQVRVREQFRKLQEMDEQRSSSCRWHVVDASKSLQEVHEEIKTIVLPTVKNVAENDLLLQKLWTTPPSYYPLPQPCTPSAEGTSNSG